jgi:hypothetical protein
MFRFTIRDAVLAAGQIATGFMAGFALWAATAPKESWDVNTLYSAYVALAGLVASFGRPRGFYWGVVGVYAGQVIALHALIPAVGVPIMPPFIGVLLFGTLPAVGGALVGAGIGYCLERTIGRGTRQPHSN